MLVHETDDTRAYIPVYIIYGNILAIFFKDRVVTIVQVLYRIFPSVFRVAKTAKKREKNKKDSDFVN